MGDRVHGRKVPGARGMGCVCLLCVSERLRGSGKEVEAGVTTRGRSDLFLSWGFDEKSYFHFFVVALQIELRLMGFSLSNCFNKLLK